VKRATLGLARADTDPNGAYGLVPISWLADLSMTQPDSSALPAVFPWSMVPAVAGAAEDPVRASADPVRALAVSPSRAGLRRSSTHPGITWKRPGIQMLMLERSIQMLAAANSIELISDPGVRCLKRWPELFSKEDSQLR
jgi:hypothetical protein